MTKNNKKQNKANKRANKNKQNKPNMMVSSTQRIPRSIPLPQAVRTTLHYTDIYLLTSTLGIATYEYSGNGVVSPDPAAPTLQPLYYDRYAGIYDKYVVIGSSIEVKLNVDTGSNQCVAVALFPFY